MNFKELEELKKTREYKAARDLEDSVNTFLWDPEKFAKAFTTMHKTLQQNVFRTIVAVIKEAASDEYNYDGRNEAAHELAKKIVETGVLDYPYLPTI